VHRSTGISLHVPVNGGSNVVYSFSVALLVRVEKCNRYAN